jgi:pantothenate kinase
MDKKAALARARTLLALSTTRRLIAIYGKPGVGKSTLVEYLGLTLPADLVSFVPMDGFHLGNGELEELGKLDRKGAPDTFDIDALKSLLINVKGETTKSVPFPIFDRKIEETISSGGEIPAASKLIFVEGNYLGLQQPEWAEVAALFDEKWQVILEDGMRQQRLIARHLAHGKSLAQATQWTLGTDEKNAKLVDLYSLEPDFIIKAE